MSDRSKVLSLHEAKTGIQYLAEQANPPRPQEQPRGREVEPPVNKCHKIRVILDSTDYFVPIGGFDMNRQPPFQFQMPVAYSVVPQPVGGIVRHDGLEIYATGLRTEFVDLPEWWSRRDDGVI